MKRSKKIYFTIFNKVHIIFIEKNTKQTIRNESVVMNFFDYVDNFIVENGGAPTTEMHTQALWVYGEFVDGETTKARMESCLKGYLQLGEFGFNFDYSGVDAKSKKILQIKIDRLVRGYENYKQLFDILKNSSIYSVSNPLFLSLIGCKWFLIRWEIADIKNIIMNSKHTTYFLESVKNKLKSEVDKQKQVVHKTKYWYVNWEGGVSRANILEVEYVRVINYNHFWLLDEQFFLSKSPVSNCWFDVGKAWNDLTHRLYGFQTANHFVDFYNKYLKFCVLGPLESSRWIWCNELEKTKQSAIIEEIGNAMKRPFINSNSSKEIKKYCSFVIESLAALKKTTEDSCFYSIRLFAIEESLNFITEAPSPWRDLNLKGTAAALTFCLIELKIIELELIRFNG